MSNSSLHRLCLPHAATPLNNIVAWRDGQAVLNRELQTRIHAWRTLLQRTTGNKFALYLHDSLEFASALLGSWLAGKTLVLPSNTLPITCAALRSAVDGYLGEFPADYAPQTPTANDAMTFTHNACTNNPYLIKDFTGLIIYTSGTTGDAQAIPKRLSQLLTEIAALENLFGKLIGTTETEIVATVSHEHIYGLLFKVLWPLMAGRKMHIRSAVFLEELAPILTSCDCILIASPAHLKRFVDSPALAMLTSSNIRAVFSSSGPLSLEVAQATAQLLGQTPIEIYGSSETGGIAWRQRPTESWQPMPSVAWRVSAEKEVLEIRSAHLPNNDWFCTADRVVSAGNGRFLLQGRADRIVKLEGKRISLDGIERQLVTSSLVADARVMMLDENNQRQRIVAFIILTNEGNVTLTKIGKHALNQLLRNVLMNVVDPIALPRSWRYLDALPVNAQGKTTHAELIALLDKRPTLPQPFLLKQDAQQVSLDLTIPTDLFYFDGHFPESPILPGVVQIDWVIHFGKQYFALPAVFCGVQALKFNNVIQPGKTVTLDMQHDVSKSALAFRLYSPMGQHASGRILFAAQEGNDER